MNFRTTLLTLLCGLFFNQLNAQKLSTSNDSNSIYLKTIQTYQDSLLQIKDKYSNWKYQGRDTLANPYYYRLFFQNGLSEDIFSESIGSLEGNNPNSSKTRDKYNYINTLIAHTYTSNPTIIKNYLPSANTKKAPILNDEETIGEEVQAPKKSDKTLMPVMTENFDTNANLVVKKPNFWKVYGNGSLQFMQAYFSNNWYKGGDNNNTLLAICNLYAN